MCYVPSVRSLACRFVNEVHTRKVEERCVFCKRTRNKTSLYRRGDEKGQSALMRATTHQSPCPALHRPGRVVVEPNMTPTRSWELTSGVIIESAPGAMVVAVTILETKGNEQQDKPETNAQRPNLPGAAS